MVLHYTSEHADDPAVSPSALIHAVGSLSEPVSLTSVLLPLAW